MFGIEVSRGAGLALAACVLAGLLPGCSREETRTVVISRGTEPAASAAVPVPQLPASVPAPVPAPADPVASAPAVAGDPASAPAASQPQEPRGSDGPALLALRPLIVPVEGVAPTALVDTYLQGRAGHQHEAIDILAPRGTRVLAVDDGKVAKLFTSKAGGLTVYQFDPEGKLAYYYAHLEGYAPGLKEDAVLRRGDLVGYVGTSGNAAPDAPHLHFAVFRLGAARQWWKGDPINPYPALRRAQPAR